MQFQVPQFIEIEDKVFGPFTFKQFIYLLGGAGLSFIFYRFLPFFLAIIFILPVAGFTLALAFYQVNNRPFLDLVQSAIKYYASSKLYVWQKKPRNKTAAANPKTTADIQTETEGPKLTANKLRDLSVSLDLLKKTGN